MLAELKFVQGSVSKKDFIPALSHFVIEDGTIRGYNGTIALGSPIPFDLSCKPRAEPLVKAIANCNETVQLSLTASGRLSVHSGKFKAFIDCVQGETPHVIAEGEAVQLNGAAILNALKKLYPFIGSDASRPWCSGILLDKQSAFATNNIILIEYWLNSDIPFPICIPKAAVKEMIRIGEPPVEALIKENSISFMYEGGRWIRAQQLDAAHWPDVRRILDQPSNPLAINDSIFEGLKIIKPFADKMGRAIFRSNVMSTHEDLTEGASFDIHNPVPDAIYSIEMLMLLENTAKSVDWTAYPKPCAFFGDSVRGAIIGLRG